MTVDIAVSLFGYENGIFFPVYISRFQGGMNLLLISVILFSQTNHNCWIKISVVFCLIRKSIARENTSVLLATENIRNTSRGTCSQLSWECSTESGSSTFASHSKLPRAAPGSFRHKDRRSWEQSWSAMDSNDNTTQEHQPCAFFYIVFRSDSVTKSPVLYRGQNAVAELRREWNHAWSRWGIRQKWWRDIA